MSVLLQVKDLSVHYKTLSGTVRAVDGVNLAINRKEVFGIVGESGCGKSTLAAGMLNLVSPPCFVVGGAVLFDGMNLFELDEESLRKMRLKRMSYIPQSSMNALNPVMKIEDQIVDGIMAHESLPREEAMRRVPILVEAVGLPPEAAKMYQHELSGGMRQRAAIAIAIALQPEFVISDEPTTALDVVVQKVILQMLVDLKEKFGSSLVNITHDMAVQAEICDRLAVMYAGKIVDVGNVQDIFEEPLHPYTKALISATPSLSRDKSETLIGLTGLPPSLLDPPKGCRFASRCPYTMEKCRKEEPQMRETRPTNWVACHLYD